jgi:hypothetical protein
VSVSGEKTAAALFAVAVLAVCAAPIYGMARLVAAIDPLYEARKVAAARRARQR